MSVSSDDEICLACRDDIKLRNGWAVCVILAFARLSLQLNYLPLKFTNLNLFWIYFKLIWRVALSSVPSVSFTK